MTPEMKKLINDAQNSLAWVGSIKRFPLTIQDAMQQWLQLQMTIAYQQGQIEELAESRIQLKSIKDLLTKVE
jgi:hypothetical protein